MRTEEASSASRVRKRQWKAAWLTGGLLFLLASGIVGLLGGKSMAPSSAHIARIDIDGPIMEAEPTVRLLDRAREEADAKAVLLRINSPGGGVGASEAIYQAVDRLAEEKPVAVSMGSTAASGGYMAALGGDRIFALNASMTGSIGVILMTGQIHELMKQIGVDFRIIKSGAYKDAGTPFKEMGEKDRQYLQSMVDQLHGQFTDIVAAERDMDPEAVQEVADGRAFTGERARELGLVDAIGDREAALDWLRQQEGLTSDTPVEHLRPERQWLEGVFPQGMVRLWSWLADPHPRFLYRMTPAIHSNG